MDNNCAQIKEKLYEKCLLLVNEKLHQLNTAYAESKEALGSEAKSTAGDKHETGRAMIQLEQEKMSRQLLETQKLNTILKRINPKSHCSKVQSGALITTGGSQTYYLAVALGKIEVDRNDIFVMAPTSPLAQAMLGKASGESFTFNGTEYVIDNIC